MASPDAHLVAVLERARSAGFVGSVPVADLIAHSEAFLPFIRADDLVMELGSGGGVPGLVLAVRRPHCQFRLIESSRRRADHLVRAARELGLDRVTVDARPAELVGRDPEVRGQARVVVARGFGPPSTTAECAAALLAIGGDLVVSEPPPEGEDDTGGAPRAARWAGIVRSGLPLRMERLESSAPRLAVLRLEETCPDRFPRSVGVPRRRLLFGDGST